MQTVCRRYLRVAIRAQVAVLAGVILAGCASDLHLAQQVATLGGVLAPYRMDVLQGNVVVREQVDMLRPGMTRQEVQAVLGTPLLVSLFHADRWDYVFSFQRARQPMQRRTVSVFFEGDRMARVQTDGELPSEREFVAGLQVRRPQGGPPVLQVDSEQLSTARPQPAPTAPTSAEAAVAAPATVSYPPLEQR